MKRAKTHKTAIDQRLERIAAQPTVIGFFLSPDGTARKLQMAVGGSGSNASLSVADFDGVGARWVPVKGTAAAK